MVRTWEEQKAYNHAYYLKNRPRRLAQARAWALANSERKKAIRRASNERNRDAIRERKRARHEHWSVARITYQKNRRALAAAFIDAAMARGCVDCGNKNLNVLDLDHVRGKKLGNIGNMKAGSLTKLFAEIDKCETRCANCHRLMTAARRRAIHAA